jgi:hypothetical protein
MAGGGFEDTDGVERRQPAAHRRPLRISSANSYYEKPSFVRKNRVAQIKGHEQ